MPPLFPSPALLDSARKRHLIGDEFYNGDNNSVINSTGNVVTVTLPSSVVCDQVVTAAGHEENFGGLIPSDFLGGEDEVKKGQINDTSGIRDGESGGEWFLSMAFDCEIGFNIFCTFRFN